MYKTTLVLATLLLTLVGCAQSPQQIKLNPHINVNSYVQNQPTVYLSVIDKRPSKSLGTRGGTYRNSNHITLAKDLQTMLKPAATAALNEMGVVVDKPSPMPIDIQLWVEKLQYDVNDTQTLPIEVKVQAQIAAVANKDSRQQVARYESSKVHKFFTAPSTEKNEQIINEIVSETLTRLFNDPKLITLIQQ
ncbi:MAG: YajG family lipoprotein [Halopseudomonas sp.]